MNSKLAMYCVYKMSDMLEFVLKFVLFCGNWRYLVVLHKDTDNN